MADCCPRDEEKEEKKQIKWGDLGQSGNVQREQGRRRGREKVEAEGGGMGWRWGEGKGDWVRETDSLGDCNWLGERLMVQGWGWVVTLCALPDFHRRHAHLGIFLICLDFWISAGLALCLFSSSSFAVSLSSHPSPTPHLSSVESLISRHFYWSTGFGWWKTPSLSTRQIFVKSLSLAGDLWDSMSACGRTCPGSGGTWWPHAKSMQTFIIPHCPLYLCLLNTFENVITDVVEITEISLLQWHMKYMKAKKSYPILYLLWGLSHLAATPLVSFSHGLNEIIWGLKNTKLSD